MFRMFYKKGPKGGPTAKKVGQQRDIFWPVRASLRRVVNLQNVKLCLVQCSTTLYDLYKASEFRKSYLKILLPLPVSAASVERSHSALQHVKTDKRANTGQDRMVALLLLFVHREIPVDYEKVIDKFASAHPRRMTFLNPLSD